MVYWSKIFLPSGFWETQITRVDKIAVNRFFRLGGVNPDCVIVSCIFKTIRLSVAMRSGSFLTWLQVQSFSNRCLCFLSGWSRVTKLLVAGLARVQALGVITSRSLASLSLYSNYKFKLSRFGASHGLWVMKAVASAKTAHYPSKSPSIESESKSNFLIG